MKMQKDKKSLEAKMKAVDEQLANLGLKDIVDTYLNGQIARGCVKMPYCIWLEELRVFAGKMPEVARQATNEVLNDVENGEDHFIQVVFLDFKTTLVNSLMNLENYVSLENLIEELKKTQEPYLMWGIKLGKISNEYTAAITMCVKIDIALAAFFTFKTDEHVKEFYDMLKAEPDGDDLVGDVDRHLKAKMAAAIMTDGLMEMFFGGTSGY